MTEIPRPAEIGMELEEVDTPALLVDLDAFEGNLRLMAQQASRAGIALRPHAKTHKCAVIAAQQIARGAVGVCCQKVSEAEALVRNGITDVLITNEVVDRDKLVRLAGLARIATIGLCVDHPRNVGLLDEVTKERGVQFRVLVEINVGGDRCGVEPGEQVQMLAERIACATNLTFMGLQAYNGRAQHLRAYAARKEAAERSAATVHETVMKLAQHGLHCEVIAGGGTGTYSFDMTSNVYNEVQPGSYLFMDADYALNEDKFGVTVNEFQQSLFVYAQVMSSPRPGYAIVDAGLKALAFDSGMPKVVGLSQVSYHRPSDEHGILDIHGLERELQLGTKLRLIPGHCDPTINLYDRYVCIRDNRVEAIWAIDGRGASR